MLAALFAPTKYGILPDQLKREELPAGNALVEAATFLAILLGTIVGGLAAARGGSPLVLVGLVMGLAVIAWRASCYIPMTGEAAPGLKIDMNLFRSTVGLTRQIRADSRIWRGTLMVSWFWTIGAVVLSLLPSLIRNTLAGSEGVITIYLALFAVGIALGSFLASWLAGGRILLLPTPLAAIVMGLFMLDVGLATMTAAAPAGELGIASFLDSTLAVRIGGDFLGMAIAGGLFIVPPFAAVQAWSRPEERARIIGGVNIVSAVCMVAGAALVAILQTLGLTAAQLFLLAAAASLVVGAIVFMLLPTNPRHELIWLVLPLPLPDRGARRREPHEGRAQPDHHRQPCELHRRAGRDVASRQQSRPADRPRHVAAVVGRNS